MSRTLSLKGLWSLVAFTLSMWALPAMGAVLRCDACDSQQINHKLVAHGGVGDRLVFDFHNGEVRSFLVSVDRDAHRLYGQPPPLQIEEQFVQPEDREAFRAIAAVWRANRGSLKFNIELGPGDFGYPAGLLANRNASDVVMRPSYRFQVGLAVATWGLGQSGPWGASAGELIAITRATILTVAEVFTGQVQIRVRVVFPDGSSAVFVIDRSHSQEARYEPGSARDSDGNPLPDPYNSQTLAGQHVFTSEDNLRRWLELAEFFGIPVVRASGRLGSGQRMGLACTSTPTGVTCRMIPI